VLTGGVILIDLDHCLDANGTPSVQAQAIIEALGGSYTERSPSGEGLHIFVLGALPPGSKKRYTYQGLHIEIYEIGRYATLTGHRLVGTPAQIQPIQQELAALVTRWGAVASKLSVLTAGEPIVTPSFPLHVVGEEERSRSQRSLQELTRLADQILAKARRAKNAAIFEELWNGGDPRQRDDKSAADFDFCLQLLYWCDDDCEIAEYLYRQSKRVDAKTDRKAARVGYTYLEVTMHNALLVREQHRKRRSTADTDRGRAT
jgi:primase-polymerase (primpol)-like protein